MQLWGLGERCKLPQRVRAKSGDKLIVVHSEKSAFCNIEYRVFFDMTRRFCLDWNPLLIGTLTRKMVAGKDGGVKKVSLWQLLSDVDGRHIATWLYRSQTGSRPKAWPAAAIVRSRACARTICIVCAWPCLLVCRFYLSRSTEWPVISDNCYNGEKNSLLRCFTRTPSYRTFVIMVKITLFGCFR